MLDGYAYYVIAIKNKEDKNYAFAQRIHRCNNLYGFFERYIASSEEITSINNCVTFKEAKTLAEAWNEAYKENGTYYQF